MRVTTKWALAIMGLLTGLLPVLAEPVHHPDRLIVTLQATEQSQQLQSLQRLSNLQPVAQQVRHFSQLRDKAVVQRRPEQSLVQLKSQLLALPSVRAVELDYKVRKTQQPNDSLYSQQWHLQALPGIQAEQAWASTTGSADLVVAVIDSGVDYNHPDLVANIWNNPLEQENGQDDSGNGYIDDVRGIDTANNTSDPMDVDGHGTLVAGIIAAAGNNGQGVAGVNWQLQILPCKFLDELGEGFTSDAIECLDYILDLKVNHGIPIVATNNSWGSPTFSEALYQAVQKHHEAGILFVASAGNSGSNLPFYPAAFDLPNVISVAAHDDEGQLASFSNFGRGHVSLSAPGVGILSTYIQEDAASEEAAYAFSSGTSMAAPVVSGLAALLKAARPELDAQGLKHHLLVGGASAIDDKVERYTMTGRMALASDGQQGAFECRSQQLLRRLAPSNDIVYLTADSWLDIRVLAINCLGPEPLAAIEIAEREDAIVLNDAGLAEDAFAGDGIHSGRWHFDGSPATLLFPDGAVQVEVQQVDFCSEQAVTGIPRRSCDALVALFYQTEGPGWFDRSGWLQHANVCDWQGLTCRQGELVALELPSNNLTGELVLDYAAFPALERLDFTGNSLTGALHSSIEAASRLQQLELAGNGLTGPIPASLGQLSDLQQLVLADNSFGGSLPSALSQLSQLRWLDLSQTNVQGTLPSSLTQLTQLVSLNYSDTRLCEPRNSAYYQWLQAIDFLAVNQDCPNQAPVVSAGANRSVASASQVQLQGTASDADGEMLQYQWEQIGGPAVQLSSATSLQASFTSPTLMQSRTLTFRLTASDLRASSSDTVTITVQPQPQVAPSPSSSGGALIWLLPLCLLLLIGRWWRDGVYFAAIHYQAPSQGKELQL